MEHFSMLLIVVWRTHSEDVLNGGFVFPYIDLGT
uniref:Uncharacterized protein n=1 Tax=Rhizophora mucronata TaxID=61149 RepID=A0A2P2NXF7_RHIMU